MKAGHWTIADMEILKALFVSGRSDAEIGEVLGRTARSVANYRYKIKLTRYTRDTRPAKGGKHLKDQNRVLADTLDTISLIAQVEGWTDITDAISDSESRIRKLATP